MKNEGILKLCQTYAIVFVQLLLLVGVPQSAQAAYEKDGKEIKTFSTYATDNSVANEMLDSIFNFFPNHISEAYSLLDQVLNMDENLPDSTKIRLFTYAGVICNSLTLFPMAIDYFQKSLAILNQTDSIARIKLYNNMGCVYLTMDDLVKAREYCEKAKEIIESSEVISRKQDPELYLVYNNIAIIERKEKNYSEAENILLKNLSFATENQDSMMMIQANQNLSNIFCDLADFDTGEQYLDKAINMSHQINFVSGLASLYANKGLILYELDSVKNIDSALYYLNKAFEISESMNQPYVQQSVSFDLYSMYKTLGDYEKALYYKEINQKLSEEAINADIIKKVAGLELKSIYDQNIKQLKEEQRRKKTAFYIILACSCFAAVFFYMLYLLQKNKVAKRKLQNEILQEKLEFKNKEFTSKAMQILQITEIMDNTYQKIQSIKKDAPEDIQQQLNLVINSLNLGKNNINWKEFEKLFIETNEGFYKKLIADYPDLTKNELRLCAFMKMNLSTKEISAITNQSERSIIMARSRLRKKLGIENEKESLTTLIMKY